MPKPTLCILSQHRTDNHPSEFLTHDFNVQSNPSVTLTSYGVNSNIDGVLKFDSRVGLDSELEHLCDLGIIPSTGICRTGKTTQTVLLQSLGIKTPRTLGACLGERMSPLRLFKGIVKQTKEYVVKDDLGAGGCNQMIITGKEFSNMFLAICKGDNVSNEKLEDKGMQLGKTSQYGKKKETVTGNFRNGAITIQEKIDVQDEWRVLWFAHGHAIIVDRPVGVDGHWQSNVDTSAESIEERSVDTVDQRTRRDILATITALVEKLNAPWLSIDVYRDSDGKYGIFEFQMEYATNSIPSMLSTIQLNTVNSVKLKLGLPVSECPRVISSTSKISNDDIALAELPG